MEQSNEYKLTGDCKQQSFQVNDPSHTNIGVIYGNNCSSNDVNKEYNLITLKKKKLAFCKHNKWTTEEDNILRGLINEFGEDNWTLVSKKMEKRSSRQCRERWKYYLNPNLNLRNWSPEEDQLILNKRKELGPKWATIATFFQNRTDAMIKTRYNALIRDQTKKKEEENQLEANKIIDSSRKKNKSKKFEKTNNQIKKPQKNDYYEYPVFTFIAESPKK